MATNKTINNFTGRAKTRRPYLKITPKFIQEHALIVNRVNGADYFLIYIALLGESLKSEFIITAPPRASMSEFVMTIVGNKNQALCNKAIKLFEQYDYIKKIDRNSFLMIEAPLISTFVAPSTLRSRTLRARKKQESQCCHNETLATPLNLTVFKPPLTTTDVVFEQITCDLRDLINNKGQLTSAYAERVWNISVDNVLKILKQSNYSKTFDIDIDVWTEIIKNCLLRAPSVIVVAAIVVATLKHKRKINDKFRYFKQCFESANENPGRYIENYHILKNSKDQEIEELIKIAKTPWLKN